MCRSLLSISGEMTTSGLDPLKQPANTSMAGTTSQQVWNTDFVRRIIWLAITAKTKLVLKNALLMSYSTSEGRTLSTAFLPLPFYRHVITFSANQDNALYFLQSVINGVCLQKNRVAGFWAQYLARCRCARLQGLPRWTAFAGQSKFMFGRETFFPDSAFRKEKLCSLVYIDYFKFRIKYNNRVRYRIKNATEFSPRAIGCFYARRTPLGNTHTNEKMNT